MKGGGPDLKMPRTGSRKDRVGALPPRYAFVLNAHVGTKFTKCPRCDTRTNVRKLSLVIHVNGFGLVLLGKTCRLCLRCETLITHKAESINCSSVSKRDYFVLGTVNRGMYRGGLSGAASLDDVKAHTSYFKSYWAVEITPAGWYPKSETGVLANIQMEPTRRTSRPTRSLRRAAHLER